MEFEEPNYDVEYLGGISASVDWVAGGNFDGYVYKNSLKFIKENQQVILQTEILDKSRYDEEIQSGEIIGNFGFSDHKTITCIFGERRMRGKILGQKKEYIAFSIFHPNVKYPVEECYEMKIN